MFDVTLKAKGSDLVYSGRVDGAIGRLCKVTKQAKTGGRVMRKLCISMVCVAVMAGSSFAGDSSWIGGKTGDWADAGNWYGGVPGPGDTAILNAGGTATISSDVGTITTTVGMNGGATMVVNMTTGGSLDVTGLYEMGRSSTGNTTFNMDGGSFTAGSMYITSFNSGTNQLTISGGTFAVAGQLSTVAGYTSSGTHTLTVSGDAASISIGSVSMNGGYDIENTLEFDFDSDGISTLGVTGAFTAGNNSLLVIDLANYVYTANQTFTLVDSTALTAFDAGNISVLNAGTLGYIVSQADNNITIEVTTEALTPDTLQVDINSSHGTVPGTQTASGWTGWDPAGATTTIGTADFSALFAADFATDGNVDVNLSTDSDTYSRNYGVANVTGSFSAATPAELWQDLYFHNKAAGAPLTITLDDLQAGAYEFTIYSYMNDLKPADMATTDIFVNEVNSGIDAASYGANLTSIAASYLEANVATVGFTVASDNDTVTISYENQNKSNFGLNGFQLEFRPAGTVIAIQ
ncbi:MAG: hypothetical protein HN341_03125 [Verrucomicrobia bacterium]|jgi:hypothetical protein|nr:hypothetical protein [Verrucomicrobiota bacterium]